MFKMRHFGRNITREVQLKFKLHPRLRGVVFLVLVLVLVLLIRRKEGVKLEVKKQLVNIQPSGSDIAIDALPGVFENVKIEEPKAKSKKDKPRWFDYARSYDNEDFRKRLSRAFPYRRNERIPTVIYQTWKDVYTEITDKKLKEQIDSWRDQEGYTTILLSDGELEDFVKKEYMRFPEVLDTYYKLPLDILRFDFARYLLIYAFGGIYTDVDTTLVKDVNQWADSLIENEFEETFGGSNIDSIRKKDIGLIVGIESDYDREDWKYKSSRRIQLSQWTFKAKKGHPVLREVIGKIVTLTLNSYSERLNHIKINGEYKTLHSVYTVLEWTGPGIFTDTVFEHLNKVDNDSKFTSINNNQKPELKYWEFEGHNKERNSIDEAHTIGWMNFTRINKPVIFDDVMILPINSFNGLLDDIEFPVRSEFTYVKHGFKGSWKNM